MPKRRKMSQGDGRGPAGEGPMTGRAMGFCAGYRMPGFTNRGQGCGMGRGRRFAYGGRNVSAYPEKETLENEAAGLRMQLESLEKRISELPEGNLR